MDVVDLRESRDQGLLEQAYNELYLACFTDPDEQEDLEQYRTRLFDPQLPPPQPQTHFLVAGERLSNPETRILYGLMIFELYRESSCGLLTYLAVSPQSRGRGLGRQLMRKAIAILSNECSAPCGLRAIFAETHDPALVNPADDTMSPQARIEVMRRLGAQRIPVRYVQPALRPGDDRSRKLLLIAFPIEREQMPRVSGQAVLQFMHEFYRALGVSSPFQDVDFQTMQRDVADAIEGHPCHEIVGAAKTLELPVSELLP